MKIGLDLDGVVIDSEKTIRTYLELYAIDELNGKNIENREEPKMHDRYNFTKEEEEKFIDKYILKCSQESNLMSGFKVVYDKLKKQGHEFVVITARGGYTEEMKTDAIRILNEGNIDLKNFYWHTSNKLEACKKEDVDIMIDDDWRIIDNLSKNGIRTLYFRDTNMKKMEDLQRNNEYDKKGEIIWVQNMIFITI